MFGFRKIFSYLLKKPSTIINEVQSTKVKFATKYGENCFVVVRVTPNDYPAILDLFWNSYFKTEPTVIAAGLVNQYNPAFESRLMSCLAQGLSLLLKCRFDGSIAGMAVNTTVCPWDPDLQNEFADTCLCTKTAQLLKFYAHVSREPNLWIKYGELKIFEITYMTMRIQAADMGMGYCLLKKSVDYGKDMMHNVIRIDATSTYTQEICEKLGMKLEYELPYNRYYSSDGKVFLHPSPPHNSVKVYTRVLRSQRDANKRNRKYLLAVMNRL